MGIILDTPITKKEVDIINGNGFRGAVVSMQGWRTSMEVGAVSSTSFGRIPISRCLPFHLTRTPVFSLFSTVTVETTYPITGNRYSAERVCSSTNIMTHLEKRIEDIGSEFVPSSCTDDA